ncbi:LacI family DNA-binding transcriptional regulator [Streptomyces sp. NBC_01803]|uniref:LacI family DNA-binding transcriptional regulator n=1 Tax=Streptomyces sp. NBC_01803 TaxID=2975946 RepID=UPI002DDAD80C|nr:LacI family DNA-binding transcriptional regulator [Streptomyces sp. NBC_01803]WSA43301.1 LacI family transcriptional regulator [Streptomyces sp. NBC_01803]
MAVTLADVAEAAGVSKSTASRVLSGSGRISPQARRAVVTAAERLGYRTNRIASGLRTRRSNLVGLIVTNLVNASFHAITSIVHQRLDELGYQVLLCITDADPARERRYLEALLDHRVDGLIIVGTGENATVVKEVETAGIPVVNLIRSPEGTPGDAVMADDHEGAVLAARHLLGLGHRRIAFIGGPASVDSGRERYAGFAQAMAEHGVEPDPALVLRGPYEPPFGDEAVTRLMTSPAARPTALYSANHEATFGVLGALVRFGVRVPDHLSLVCHEEAPFFAYWHPPITVVDNAPRDLGELAAEQLLRRIEKGEAGRGGTSRSLRVGAQLVVRRSTAAWQPPAARPGDDG